MGLSSREGCPGHDGEMGERKGSSVALGRGHDSVPKGLREMGGGNREEGAGGVNKMREDGSGQFFFGQEVRLSRSHPPSGEVSRPSVIETSSIGCASRDLSTFSSSSSVADLKQSSSSESLDHLSPADDDEAGARSHASSWTQKDGTDSSLSLALVAPTSTEGPLMAHLRCRRPSELELAAVLRRGGDGKVSR